MSLNWIISWIIKIWQNILLFIAYCIYHLLFVIVLVIQYIENTYDKYSNLDKEEIKEEIYLFLCWIDEYISSIEEDLEINISLVNFLIGKKIIKYIIYMQKFEIKNPRGFIIIGIVFILSDIIHFCYWWIYGLNDMNDKNMNNNFIFEFINKSLIRRGIKPLSFLQFFFIWFFFVSLYFLVIYLLYKYTYIKTFLIYLIVKNLL